MNEFLSNLSVGERLERFLKVIGYDVSISDDALQVLLHDGLQFKNDEGKLLLVNLIANELVISCENVRLRESKLKLAVKSSSVTYSADDDEAEILNEVPEHRGLVEEARFMDENSVPVDSLQTHDNVSELEFSGLNNTATPNDKLISVASNEPEIVKQSWGKRLYEFIFGL